MILAHWLQQGCAGKCHHRCSLQPQQALYNDAKSFANKGFNILGSPFTMIALAASGIAVAMVASKV
jgi:hypothetical protein